MNQMDFIILIALAEGTKHGYAILQSAKGMVGHKVSTPTLYRHIGRLVRWKWIEVDYSTESIDARRRCYKMTAEGTRAFADETKHLLAIVNRAAELI